MDGHHCGCDHDCSCDGGEDEVLTLIDENGEERNFTVIDILEVEGTEYAILLPVDEESDEAIILRFEKDEEGNELLVDIEDDEEWEKVADAWEEMIAQEE
ncbi:DUF1292 domain-containing protein [Desulfocucumis palustris]|uniref:DUF1292 domain-containing protein n=1 Tax=Desulfocucumis palustris TaxID=1898651 RepID=UPI000CE9F56F|nr:DUF1292 domain-containing protein [Desulfocucumis palustris]